ncbi:hypothetical protein B9Z55_011484 [Caenorhabditis nigoni]|uniref:F-box domain-containing protein n=3 Tax=Caenorhabditis nigoni TaxID=1611254 RepID=A0A2G5UKA5_9PELO|nr:hypothetical protein B9Z55_011484 [Caenorhabditis nigoni]
MKLSKLPYLVQQEVLNNMAYPHLFLLSFVSKNMKELIKSSQIARFKSIVHIAYDCTGKDQPKIDVFYKEGWDQIVRVVEEVANTDSFQLNVSGKLIDFRLSENVYLRNSPIASVVPSQKESVIKSIHEYFLGFFGDSVKYRWETDDWEFLLVQLQNVSYCFRIDSINSGVANIQQLEHFVASNPVFKRIEVYARIDTIEFSPESKFYEAESMKVDQNEHTFPEVLRHFQGRHAFIRCRYCEISELIKFVNKWKTGGAFQKLEYLKIRIRSVDEGLPQDEILNGIGAKYVDAAKSPPTHVLPKVYLEYSYSKPNTDRINSHTYVVRETDNHVASIRIFGKTLWFGVWNKTEDQFLGMMD